MENVNKSANNCELHDFSALLSALLYNILFQNISFIVSPGEVVALVGPSGGGKTSCINLLEHFYTPDYGQVLLDSRPVQEYEHHYLHRKVTIEFSGQEFQEFEYYTFLHRV